MRFCKGISGICGEYVVTDCGLREDAQKGKIYECFLESEDGAHKLFFDLCIRKERPVEKDLAQYAAIAPHIRKGDLIRCEFGYLYNNDGFYLGLFSFLKLWPVTLDGKPIDLIDYRTPRRGYRATTKAADKWIHVPGRLGLGGENKMPILPSNNPPELYRPEEASSGGHFIWVPRSIREKGFLRRFKFLLPFLREKPVFLP